MKLKNVLLSVGLALSAGAMIGAAVYDMQEPAVEAGASTLQNSVYLQFDGDVWKSSSSKIALYFFNNSVSKNAWGDFLTPDGNSTRVLYEYSLDFVPTGCIAFRFDPGVQTCGQWCFDNDRSNSAVWSTTNNIDFRDVIYLGNHYENSKWTTSGSYDLDVIAYGNSTDDLASAEMESQLTHVKLNIQNHHFELYGEITLPADYYFKCQKLCDGDEGWIENWSTHSSLYGRFPKSWKGNIQHSYNSQETYEFYVDFDAKTLYITTPVISAADEWSDSFLTGVKCDATGASLPTGWSTLAETYALLDGDVKDYIYAMEGNEDTGASSTAQAVARYDQAVKQHSSLEKFIKDRNNNVRSSLSSKVFESPLINTVNDHGAFIIAVTAITIGVTAAGVFFIRRRNEQ